MKKLLLTAVAIAAVYGQSAHAGDPMKNMLRVFNDGRYPIFVTLIATNRDIKNRMVAPGNYISIGCDLMQTVVKSVAIDLEFGGRRGGIFYHDIDKDQRPIGCKQGIDYRVTTKSASGRCPIIEILMAAREKLNTHKIIRTTTEIDLGNNRTLCPGAGASS